MASARVRRFRRDTRWRYSPADVTSLLVILTRWGYLPAGIVACWHYLPAGDARLLALLPCWRCSPARVDDLVRLVVFVVVIVVVVVGSVLFVLVGLIFVFVVDQRMQFMRSCASRRRAQDRSDLASGRMNERCPQPAGPIPVSASRWADRRTVSATLLACTGKLSEQAKAGPCLCICFRPKEWICFADWRR